MKLVRRYYRKICNGSEFNKQAHAVLFAGFFTLLVAVYMLATTYRYFDDSYVSSKGDAEVLKLLEENRGQTLSQSQLTIDKKPIVPVESSFVLFYRDVKDLYFSLGEQKFTR